MSKKAAINQLRRALEMADLPSHETYLKDADGEVTAACYAFKVGSMEESIKAALRELGAELVN